MNFDIWDINGVEYIIAKDFAVITGVTRATVYNWIRFNYMPAVRSRNGRFLIPLKEALAWVGKNKV